MAKINKDAVAAIRSFFTETHNRDLKLTDETINGIFNSEKWDDLSEDEQMELLLKSEGIAQSVMVTDPGISVLANKLDEDDKAQEEITACIDATMKAKASAVDVYALFRRIYTKDELDAMPYPGTEAKDVGENQKPDIVKTTDNTGKKITKTWTNDFVSTLRRGKELENKIVDIKKEQKTPGSVPALKGKGSEGLAAELSDATARRNALRNMVKRAISVHHQYEAINAMPLVSIRWIKGKDGQTVMPDKCGTAKGRPVTGAPKPLWMFTTADAGEDGRDFSVTQMLAMDPAKALKAGGTLADLVATAATGADTPEGETQLTVDDFVSSVADFSTVLNKRENMALLLTKVAPVKDEDDTSADDLLESICRLYLNLAPIYNKNKSRYEAIINKDEEEEPARKVG